MENKDFKVWSGLAALALWFSGCATPLSHTAMSPHHPGIEVPPGQVRLRQIHPDVWVHVSTMRFNDGSVFPMNGMIVRDGGGLLLVDTAWGETATKALLDEIERNIGLPVKRAVVTHFHDDRLSGSRILEKRGVAVFCTELTKELAMAEGNATPSSILQRLAQPGSSVTIGPAEAFYPGPGHARDNIVIYVPGAKVLFGGCAVHEMARKGPGNIADADLDHWPKALRMIQAHYRDAITVIPGHGIPGGPELLSHSIEVIERYQASNTR